jgi:hypothetical protein
MNLHNVFFAIVVLPALAIRVSCRFHVRRIRMARLFQQTTPERGVVWKCLF